MFLSRKSGKRRCVSLIVTLVLPIVLLGFSAISRAADSVLPETVEPKKLELVVGKSIILKSSGLTKRVSIADPEIAAFILISPREIYVTGGYAQFLAASLIPATLFSFHRLITQQRPIYVVLGSILLSSIMLYSPVATLTFVPSVPVRRPTTIPAG